MQVEEFDKIGYLVKDAAFKRRDHILDVNKRIFPTRGLEQFQCLLDQLAQVLALPLTVVDPISRVHILLSEYVEDWQNLPIVRHKCLSNHFSASHQLLEDLQSDTDDVWIAGVKSGLDRDDELRDDGEYLVPALVQHVENALD
jgi:hypothetical protein